MIINYKVIDRSSWRICPFFALFNAFAIVALLFFFPSQQSFTGHESTQKCYTVTKIIKDERMDVS